ncbi:MAG TPA: hypothetical protein VGH58_01615 [Solirubrobacterales bacterium]
MLLGAVAPANAALPTHPELPALGQTGFARVCGLAVDSAGDRYVAEFTAHEVKVYSPSGTEITHFATSANTAGPCGLAVDSQGNVYVNGRIKDVVKYKPSSFPPTGSTTYAPDTSVNTNGVLVPEEARGVAVDPANDDVYVAFNGHISSYEPNGTPISETLGAAALPGAAFTNISVRGSTGRIYVFDTSSKKAYVLSSDGSKVLTEVDGSTTQAGGLVGTFHGIAVDQSNGHFYLSDIAGSAEETPHNVVDEFDSGGELVSELPVTPGLKDGLPAGIAVDNSGGANNGVVFFSAGQNPASVFAFGPLTYAKFFELQVAKTGVGQGTVTSTPAGVQCGSACKVSFQEGTEVTLTATAGADSRFSSWKGCDSVAGNECTVTISAKRKVTAKFTAKPTIESENVRPLDTAAQLEAEINPNSEATSYQFEFLSEAAYQANGGSFSGPEEPLEVPASPESIGSGDEGVSVSAQVPNLTPHTAYRFRVVTSNAAGASEGKTIAFTTYLPPHVFSPCANDGFRSGAGASLSDCRAYEQASPVDKNFGDATGRTASVRASTDGSRISFQTFAPIAGDEGAQTFDPVYLASRGAAGWPTRGLQLPQSIASGARFSNATPDLTHVYSYGVLIGEPSLTGIFDRDTTNGSLTTVVPHTAEFTEPVVPAMSDDGSVVLFEYEGAPLKPGAAENRRNLYAWDRESSEYRLAGVLNDGKAPPRGVTPGNADVSPNTAYTSDEHAISADGKIVYFTDNGTHQLYARVNPTEPQSDVVTNSSGEEECTQPELACTYLVSRSQRETKGPDPAGAQTARFRGATPDGSKAFFTDSEMLTDDANTGPEQQPSAIARAKVSGSEAEEEELGFLPAHAIGVTTSGGYIYWADPNASTIGRAKLNGDEPPSEVNPSFIEVGPTEFETRPYSEPGVLQQVPSRLRYLAVDSEYIYWTNTGSPDTEGQVGKQIFIEPRTADTSGTIGRAKLGPSGAEEIKPEFITGASDPRGIALDSDHLYWVNNRRFGDNALASTLGRATLEGEGPDQAYCDRVELGIGAGGSQTILNGIAIHGDDIYIGRDENGAIDGHSSTVQRNQLSTCTWLGQVYTGTSDITGVATDGSYVYWAVNGFLSEAGLGRIGRLPAADFAGSQVICYQGPRCEEHFIELEGNLGGLALDGEHLYWGINGESAPNLGADLYRYDAASNELTDLTPDVNPADEHGTDVLGVLGSSEDGSTVYFAANGVLADGASPGSCLRQSKDSFTGKCNLYVEHGDEIDFIARLDTGDSFQGFTDAANWSQQSGGGSSGEGGVEKASRVSADGSTLLFTSAEKLTGYENESMPELYRYRIGEPIVCVSCNPTGLPPSFPAATPRRPTLFNKALDSTVSSNIPSAKLSRNLSADGNRVFFQTPEKLVVEDTNGDDGCGSTFVGTCQDVYEWEAKGTGSCESEEQNGGCLYLISSGKSKDPSYLADASVSGNDVFFFTRDRLAAQDEDSFVDVYDARVGGGLAAQNESAPPPPCEGEACKEGASALPQVGTPTTSLFSGPGNPKPQHKKAKHRKRKHKHRRHAHRRHAKHNGRAHR